MPLKHWQIVHQSKGMSPTEGRQRINFFISLRFCRKAHSWTAACGCRAGGWYCHLTANGSRFDFLGIATKYLKLFQFFSDLALFLHDSAIFWHSKQKPDPKSENVKTRMVIIVITVYSPSCLGEETAKGLYGLRVWSKWSTENLKSKTGLRYQKHYLFSSIFQLVMFQALIKPQSYQIEMWCLLVKWSQSCATRDLDWNQEAQPSYYIVEDQMNFPPNQMVTRRFCQPVLKVLGFFIVYAVTIIKRYGIVLEY